MTDLDELIRQLSRMKVQTGSLVCLGCGLEHNCGIHGCAVLRSAIVAVRQLDELRGGCSAMVATVHWWPPCAAPPACRLAARIANAANMSSGSGIFQMPICPMHGVLSRTSGFATVIASPWMPRNGWNN